MPRLSVCLAVIGVTITLPFSSSRAQGAHRSGVWVGAGLAKARADLTCSICVPDAKSMLSGYLRAGVNATSTLSLGLEATGVTNNEDGVNERYLGLSAVALFYPLHNGLYFKTAAGVLTYRASDGTDEFTAAPLMVQAGAGYELPVSRRVALVPFLNLLASSRADLQFNGTKVTSDAGFTLIQLGIGVALH